MVKDIITPNDSEFFDWHYSADECVEQLNSFMHSPTPVLASVSDWVALSLETQAVAYYKNELQTVKKLIQVIASVALAFEPSSLQEFPTLLHTVLRAALCLPAQVVEVSRLVELYRMLPHRPTAKNLDIHIIFQCYFGFTNRLHDWRKNFKRYESESNWLPYNAVQLDVGIALVNEQLFFGQALITDLELQLPDYIMATETEPMAAEWFPWLLWFARNIILEESEYDKGLEFRV